MYIKAKFNDIFHIVARFPYNSLATPVTERYPSARYDTIHKTIRLSDTHNTNKQIDFTVNEHDSMLILIKQIFSLMKRKIKHNFHSIIHSRGFFIINTIAIHDMIGSFLLLSCRST